MKMSIRSFASRCRPIPVCWTILVLSPGLSGFEGAGPRPEDFADRWVEAIQKGDEARIRNLFTPDAELVFEVLRRKRSARPDRYAALVSGALGEFKKFERSRGSVELAPVEINGEEGKSSILRFTVTDTIRTSHGFVLTSEADEEFEFAPGSTDRAVRYRSQVRSCEAVEQPEEWIQYGGPKGLNGFLLEENFHAAPEGMGLFIVVAVVALLVIFKVLYTIGVNRTNR